ncbi:MAG: alpha/beta hydrolase [Bacteroidota bacterium]
MPPLLPAIEVETAPHPRFAVIWLHGLGADGSDFEPIIPHLGLPAALAVRFIFPHAPAMPVTCNGGYVMPAWYDITSLDGPRRTVDEAGIRASCAAIRALIAHQNELGIACANIVLAGFSQGGAMAYSVGLTHPAGLAGIIALSAYIPAPALLAEGYVQANERTPIFVGHGTADDVVPLTLGRQAHDLLQGQGYPIDWHDYPMPHSVCIEEIADIGRWLNERFAAG